MNTTTAVYDNLMEAALDLSSLHSQSDVLRAIKSPVYNCDRDWIALVPEGAREVWHELSEETKLAFFCMAIKLV